MKKRDLSVLCKILAMVFVVASYVIAVVFGKRLPTWDESMGIIAIGVFIAEVMITVDISMIVQNIKGLKDNA